MGLGTMDVCGLVSNRTLRRDRCHFKLGVFHASRQCQNLTLRCCDDGNCLSCLDDVAENNQYLKFSARYRVKIRTADCDDAFSNDECLNGGLCDDLRNSSNRCH